MTAADSGAILLVEGEPTLQTALADALLGEGFAVQVVSSAEEALARVGDGAVPVVVTEVALPGRSGIELGRQVRLKDPDATLILLSGSDDPRLAAAAMRLGAHDYLVKSLDGTERLIASVRAAVAERERAALRAEEERAHQEKERTHAIEEWVQQEEARRAEAEEQRRLEEEQRRADEERRRAEEAQRLEEEEQRHAQEELRVRGLILDALETAEQLGRELGGEPDEDEDDEPQGPYRVMVVDDEAPLLSLYGEVLGREGFQVETMLTGEEALTRLEDGPIDLLVVDKNLPGMSGIEVLARARALYPRLEAIVITGFGSLQSAVEAVRLRARAYLLKPLEDVEELARLVREARDEQRAQAGDVRRLERGLEKQESWAARCEALRGRLEEILPR